jgi:hypothetical protein
MLVYTFTQYNSWDRREIMSVLAFRKRGVYRRTHNKNITDKK